MEDKRKYTATLTSDAFLYYELKRVLKLKVQGISDEQIRKKVMEENLFQYKSKRSLRRLLSSVMRRVKVLDDYLINMVVNDPMETGKLVNLYAIMKTSRLFYEFMNEVVREKFEYNDMVLEKKDVNLFFRHKAEQSEIVAKWTDNTISKLKQVILKILTDAGVLESPKTGKLNKIIMPVELKSHLIEIGDIDYVIAMGEKI
ncbi:DUF1819 family protein [Caldicellulosiruptor sp. DIB 104C]|uniref:DUF1819 family protein n=1 Tax=Caldicellulosiruptor sp. DIB 104C TaxID=3019889 RepID=UPI002304E19E